MTLDQATFGMPVTVQKIDGDQSFRRRLMELGCLPGTTLELIRAAPLRDPLVFRVRGCDLSIRRQEATCIAVVPAALEAPIHRTAPLAPTVAPHGSST